MLPVETKQQKAISLQSWHLFSWDFRIFQTSRDFYLEFSFLIYIFILTGNSLIIIITRVDPMLQTPLRSSLQIATGNLLRICHSGILVTLGLRTEAFLHWAAPSDALLSCPRSARRVLCPCVSTRSSPGHWKRFFLFRGRSSWEQRPEPCASACSICAAPSAHEYRTGPQSSLRLGAEFQSRQHDTPGVLTALLRLTPDRPLLLWHPPAWSPWPVGTLRFNKFVSSCGLLRCLPRFLSSWFLSSWFLSSWNVKIISAIWKPHSATGQSRAFSTCSSCLTVVLLLFGSVTIAYLHPKPNHSTGTWQTLSVSYTATTPVFNTLLLQS